MSGHRKDGRPRARRLHTVIRSAILGLVLLGVFSSTSDAVQDFTCYNQKLYIGSGDNLIGGYKSGNDKEATVTFERVLDTGSGNELLPAGLTSDHSSVAAKLFKMTGGGADRFGAYNCIAVNPDQTEVKITNFVMDENAHIIPVSPTKIAVAGDSVTLTMTTTSSYTGSQDNLRWKHDGNDITASNGDLSVTINIVQETDAGIYECFQDGYRGNQIHGIMKLLVRGCALDQWGPPLCNRTCPVCHNGGVCDDKTGECICAPGFSRDFCEELFGKNKFGQDSGITCSSSKPVTACRNNLMCLPDPFGCTCAASFTGVNCEHDCGAGYFGAGCRELCHCAGDAACDPGHGRCPNDVQCEDGYRGENCQNACPTGKIGVDKCVDCPVPVAVKDLTFTATSDTDRRAITWDIASNMCPVSFYTVQYELMNRDQCQPLSGTYLDVETTVSLNLQIPTTDSRFFPYSSYKIRVRASNEAAGLGRYLDDVANDDFITPEQAPSAPPDNVEHLNVTDIGVSFLWDEVPCGSRGGEITGYSYKLMTSSGTERNSVTLTRSLSLDGLLPCSDYKFKVAAQTSVGSGLYSNETLINTTTKAHLPVANLNAIGRVDELQVTWDSPDVTQNPCSLEYTIQYELIDRDQCETITSPVRPDAVTQPTPGITLDSLDAYSTYTVYVWTSNEAGFSEERSINTTTASKAPSMSPAGFQLTEKTKHSITVSWNIVPCGDRNGAIIGYRMRHKVLDRPYDKTFDSSTEEFKEEDIVLDLKQNTTGLDPSTQYEFQVAGLVRVGDEEMPGPYATMMVFTAVETDIEKPQKPSVDTSLTTSSTVTISLNPPTVTTYITDFQIGVLLIQPAESQQEGNGVRGARDVSSDLYAAGEFSKDSLPDSFEVGDGQTYGGYYNKPLESSTEYEIFLGSVSRTSSEETTIVWGDPIKVEVIDSGGDAFPAAAVVVPILLVLLAIIAAVGFIVMRRRQNQQKKDLDSESLQVGEINDEKNTYSSTPNVANTCVAPGESIAMATTSINHPPSPEKPKPRKRTFKAPDAIPLDVFEDFVQRKKAETFKEGNRFLFDYKNLPDGVLHFCSVAKEENNRVKNRYANIIPYDDSRVVLEKLPGDPNSDFVNASYIDGFSTPNQYIATQGPNKASVSDMWRMVWQENSTKIVMLTNLQEGIKSKCEQYWPDNMATYGDINVKLVKEVKRVDYIIRDFILSDNSKEQKTRKVRQYHFTTWPDMGLPQDPSKVMNFVKTVKEYDCPGSGPTIVHCSAGVGRTGTFIILDAMLNQAKAEGKVDIWNFASGMRDRRMKMIQTSAQYEFVFDALLDEFQCGDKTIKSEELRTKLSVLRKIQKSSRKTGIQEQFESLDMVPSTSSSDQYRGGQDPENIHKNRFPDIIPVDRLRPRLMIEGEAGSNDYINASFLNSYSAKSGYITTQMPLPHTVPDLWRMAYDYNATCIVMLNSMDDKTFAPYWPTEDEESIKFGPLSVILESTDQLGNGVTMRNMKLTNEKMKGSRKIRQFQLSDWPKESRVPASPRSALQIVTAVHQWQKDHESDRVIIHCINGVRASGTFCALLNIMANLSDGNVVDVYRAVKRIRVARAGMVPTLEHYSFLYRAVQSHLDTDIVYENL